MKFSENESRTLTLVQAFGIVSVVIGHLGNQPFDVLSPYVFHMPLFFFLGGLLFSVDKGLFVNLKRIISKHGSYLLKSYIITGVLAVLLVKYFEVEQRKPFADGFISTILFTIKNNFGNNPLFVVGWFLFTYIIASIISVAFLFALKNQKYARVIIMLTSLISFYVGMEHFPHKFTSRDNYIVNLSSQVFTATGFMMLGYLIKDYAFRIIRLDISLCLMTFMICVSNAGMQKGVNIAWSNYPLGMTLSLITSLSGIYIVFAICKAASNLSGSSDLLLLVGKNSKTIMTYHFFVFYLADIVFYFFGYYDITKSAPYSHFKSVYAWPVYVLSGVIIPILFVICYDKIKSIVKKNILFLRKV